MDYLSCYKFFRERLVPVNLKSNSIADTDDEHQLQVVPITCTSFKELCDHLFQSGRKGLEYTDEIRLTAATMAATVLSTTTTGGQLGLRVMGEPGSAKSVLSECMSCCTQLVYPRSKFTGIVSGLTSVKRSQNMAVKMNGKCVLVKDADPMIQQGNIRQIESEIRDALGDGVIRAEFKTGREHEIFTLFSMILCGTHELKKIDDAALGARFLDIFIQKRGADTSRIVKRAIQAQFDTIAAQFSGEVEYNGAEVRRSEKILTLAPPTVGFLLHKHQQIKSRFKFIPPTEDQLEQVYAMGEFIAYMRQKIRRDKEGDLTHRPFKETGTRLGEQIIRFLMYLSVVFQDVPPYQIGQEEFNCVNKMVRDTADGFPFDIVNHLVQKSKGFHSEDPERGADTFELVNATGLSRQGVLNMTSDLKDAKVVQLYKAPNSYGRGNETNVYVLTDELSSLCRKAGL